MKRREFIALLGGAAAAWPVSARAQQPTKVPTIGILGSGTPATQGHWYAAFVQRLRELGWIDGRTVAIEYRWAEGRDERAAEIAAEFVRRKVDVIVTAATAVVVAAKQATSVIPIVFAAAGDPVGTGLVASLARPGGNVTGLSVQSVELVGKRLELLREVIPGLHQLAMLVNVGSPLAVLERGEVQAAARTLGPSDAVQTITCGVTAMRSTGTTMWMPFWLSHLARANAEICQHDDARRCIIEAIAAVETAKERWCEAEVNRVAGEIALLSPESDVAKAEAHFERALAVAREQQEKPGSSERR
jgi:ABC transporter substrate binding protein